MPQYSLDDLLTLMARLREPIYGCPWDQKQTYQSIVSSTLEEAYEVVDAVEQNDRQQLREELGDLLFQIVFYSEIAQEENAFTFADIVSDLTSKLIRRHPHVFPDGTLASRIPSTFTDDDRAAVEAKIKTSWELIKQQERLAKGHHSILDDVPTTFPAIVRATKLQKRASSVGFDWRDVSGVFDKLDEESKELEEAVASGDKAHIEDEMGDMFFTLVNACRHLRTDPETALRKANQKFEQRFRIVEQQASDDGVILATLDESELEQRWQNAKQELS